MNDIKNLGLKDLDAVSGGAAGDTELNKGAFQSSTGTGLNIRVDWRVVSGLSGSRTLEIQVSAQSYSLYSAALQNGVELRVGGMTYLADSQPVSYSGAAQTCNTLASFSIPNLSGPVSLSVIWRFRGTYSGVSLNEVRAEGLVTV